MIQWLFLQIQRYPSSVIWKLETVRIEYQQQKEMFDTKSKRIDNRIVSISQPHVRSIVRGKAGTPVAFGAKISVSLLEGFCFIARQEWDYFNDSSDLIGQIETYKKRYGYYPKSVHADKIYQTRENKKFCKDNNIRMTGKPLGRPAKQTEENKEKLISEKKQRQQDDKVRITIEDRFGVGKRRYGLGLIK